MKIEILSSMAVLRGISYNELRYYWSLGMLSSRISIFKFLTCDVKGVLRSVDCGICHPFNTTSSDTIILLVLPSYTFTSFPP